MDPILYQVENFINIVSLHYYLQSLKVIQFKCFSFRKTTDYSLLITNEICKFLLLKSKMIIRAHLLCSQFSSPIYYNFFR